MLRRLALALALPACSPPPPPACPAGVEVPAPAVTSAPVSSAAAASASASAPAAKAAAVQGSLCWARGRPSVKPPEKGTAYCGLLDSREVARAEAQVRKAFVVNHKPSKLVVDFGCDLASSEPRDVFFEDGSGHGGSLRLARLRREPQRVAVRMVSVQHYSSVGLEVHAGDIDLRAFDALLATMRVTMLARPHLIEMIDPSGGIGGLSMSFSSNDFHLRLSIVDKKGQETDRHFTGYDSSSEQEHMLPMVLAATPLQKMLAATKLEAVEPTDDDRQFFTARFLRTMAGEPFWWVRERYVAAAAKLGTIDAVPALVAIVARASDPSAARSRESALAAIAAITGWDPRLDADQKPRSLDEAAAAVVEQCSL